MLTKIFKPASLLLFIFFLFLGACSQSDNADVAGDGSVSVLIKDAPVEEAEVSEEFKEIKQEFDQILVTATSITLIGEGGHVLLSGETITFDLLDLYTFSKVLALSVVVPADTYTKLRFEVTEIVMLQHDTDGDVIRKEYPKLPSEKIDILAQDGFVVGPGSDLIISLDMRTADSIKYHSTGNEKYIFRPVVRVLVETGVLDDLIKKSGIVLQKQATSFYLCKEGTTVVNDDDCTLIHVSVATRFLTEDIELSSFAELKNGDAVAVLGRLASDAASINAIQVQHTSDLQTVLAGVFDSAVIADVASFTPSTAVPGLIPGTTIDCILPLALVINKDGVVVGPGAIMSGVKAEVFGLLVPDNVNPTGIKAGYIIVE